MVFYHLLLQQEKTEMIHKHSFDTVFIFVIVTRRSEADI